MGTLTFDIFSLRDHIVEFNIVICLALYGVYLVTLRVLQLQYKLRFHTRPPQLKMFRIYNSKQIEYIPYSYERSFYKTTNRVTLTFNAMLIGSLVIYLAAAIL